MNTSAATAVNFRSQKVQAAWNNLAARAPQLADQSSPLRPAAILFARGQAAINGHPELLSGSGHKLRNEVNLIMPQNTEQHSLLGDDELGGAIAQLATQLPLTEDFKPDLFLTFPAGPFERAVAAGKLRFWVSILEGCSSGCIMCQADNERLHWRMPLSMLFALANTIQSVGGKMLLNFNQSECFDWRDSAFDADLGDIFNQLMGQIVFDGERGLLQTHGWWENNPYAQSAAEKISPLVKDLDSPLTFHRVTVNFQHREFLDPDVTPETLTRWIDRFVQAITMLHPNSVRVAAASEMAFARGRRILPLTYDFASEVWRKRILPEVIARYPSFQPLTRVEGFDYLDYRREYYDHYDLGMGCVARRQSSDELPIYYSEASIYPWVSESGDGKPGCNLIYNWTVKKDPTGSCLGHNLQVKEALSFTRTQAGLLSV